MVGCGIARPAHHLVVTSSDEEISHTSQNLSKVDTLPSFNSLAALVEEEVSVMSSALEVKEFQGMEKRE